MKYIILLNTDEEGISKFNDFTFNGHYVVTQINDIQEINKESFLNTYLKGMLAKLREVTKVDNKD